MGAIALLWYPLALALIAIAGVLKLEHPFGRDQAIHHWMALRMMDGAVAYRDVWDVKQPAILAFHSLAIALFGPTVRAVHLLELIWMLVLAVLIMVLLRGYFRHRWLSAAAAVAAIVPYFAFAEDYSQTQVEIMVGLPFFLTAWCLWKASQTDRHTCTLAFAAGIAAGIGTAFKHILAPIPVAFALLAAWHLLRRPRPAPAMTSLGRLWVPFAAGVIAVWSGIALVFLFQGGFADFFWTNFVWPIENLAAGDPAPLSRLVEGAAVLVASTLPWLLLALATVDGVVRSNEPKFTSYLWTWIVAAAAALLLQRTSWWAYHFLLFYVPIGILGVRGIDRIVGALTTRANISPLAAMGLTALLVSLPLAGLARPLGEDARTLWKAFYVKHLDADGYRRQNFPVYAGAAAVADYLNAAGGDETVYAIDDMTMVLLSHRNLALPVPGQWFAALKPVARWQDIPQRLEANPPRYFFLESRLATDFATRYPALMAVLERDYKVAVDVPFGRLYEKLPPPAASTDTPAPVPDSTAPETTTPDALAPVVPNAPSYESE